MVKRKLAISKSTKGKTNETNKISGVKIKKILEHVSTEDFMKFRPHDAKTELSPRVSATESKSLVKLSKPSIVKGISKKDKMLFKKQRLLQKFDAISLDVNKGLSKKRKKKLNTENLNETVKVEAPAIQDKIILKELQPIDKTDILKKSKKETKTKEPVSFKKLLTNRKTEKSLSEKLTPKTTIFKKAKSNSNKNRQRNFSKGLKAYKKQMKKKDYVEDPIKAITECVNAFVRKETAV